MSTDNLGDKKEFSIRAAKRLIQLLEEEKWQEASTAAHSLSCCLYADFIGNQAVTISSIGKGD